MHVIHSSAFGGGPNMLTILCRQLADRYEMKVICDGQGDMPSRVEELGIHVRTLPLTTKWSFTASIPRLAQLVRADRPHVVHLHGQFAGSLGQISITLAGRPATVYTAQWPSYLDDAGAWSKLRNATAERVSCAGARVVAVLSESDRREFIRRRLADASKIVVLPNAYLVDSADGPPPRSDQPVVGFVGRLVDQKGCEFLLRAAPRVVAAVPQARLVIIGDGPDRANLEQLARDERIAPSVDFVGYDPHPSLRMREMAVLAVPSVYEPLGMVALEAMACGVPVVASSVGGLPEVVDDGKTGRLVPARNAEALAAAIVEVLTSPERAAAMGNAGLAKAKAHFSPEVISARYAEIYDRLAASASS